MSTHLSGGRLNVALVQETMRKDLLNLLQLCEGPKVSFLFTILTLNILIIQPLCSEYNKTCSYLT